MKETGWVKETGRVKELPNLDFLRSVAVISVVVEHLLMAYGVQWIGGWEVRWIGIVGVFLFFVHTALVLMWSMERREHTLDFYVRRVFRIYPLAVVALVVTMVFHARVTGVGYLPAKFPQQYLLQFLLLPDIVGHYLPVGVMWSLPYEVQMYLVLPLLYFFARKNFHVWPLLLFFGFTVALCRAMFPDGASYTNFVSAIPYFLPGVMAYVGFGRHKAVLPAWLLPVGLALLWAGFMVHPNFRRGDVVCLLAGLGLPWFHQLRAAWLVRGSHVVAKYSYSIYLAHPFSMALAQGLMPHQGAVAQLVVILGSLAVFSVAGYHLVERPMIRLGSRMAGLAERRFEQHELGRYRIAETEIG